MAKKKVKESGLRLLCKTYNPNECGDGEYVFLHLSRSKADSMLQKRTLLDLCRQFGNVSSVDFFDWSIDVIGFEDPDEFEGWASELLYDPYAQDWFDLGTALVPGYQSESVRAVELVVAEAGIQWEIFLKHWSQVVMTPSMTWEDIEAVSAGSNPFSDRDKLSGQGVNDG